MKAVFAKKTDKLALALKLPDDKLKLFIDVEKLVPEPLKKEELLQIIAEHVPVADLDQGVLDDIVVHLNKGEKIEERRIRKGQAPEPGSDGKIVFMIKKFTATAEVRIDEKGFADYGDLHLFDNLQVGQIVARVYEPKKGVDGLDVYGKVIPAVVGKPANYALDNTLVLKETGNPDDHYKNILAQVEGFVVDQGGKLSVKEEFTVKGDLDFHVGNIDFIGRVKVSGKVPKGFKVKAKKGIDIGGDVEGATLISAEGDITVKGYLLGGDGAKVFAGKTLTASRAQDVDAEVIGNVSLKKDATNCLLRTEGSLLMPEGMVIGSKVFAVCGVEAKELGNEAGQATDVTLCSDVETSTEYNKLLAEISNHDKAIQLIGLHLGPYAKNPGRIQRLNQPFRSKMEKLWEKLGHIEQSKARLLNQQAEMLKSSKVNSVMRVNFLSIFYPGTLVHAGQEIFSTLEQIKGPASLDYLPQEKKFLVGELKPLEYSVEKVEVDVLGEKQDGKEGT